MIIIIAIVSVAGDIIMPLPHRVGRKKQRRPVKSSGRPAGKPPPPPPPQPGHRKGLILGGGLSICFEKASEVTCGRGRRTVDYGLWVVGCGLAGWRAWGGCSWAGGRLLLPFTLFPIRSTLLFSHSLSLSPPRLRSPDFSSSLLLSSPHPT